MAETVSTSRTPSGTPGPSLRERATLVLVELAVLAAVYFFLFRPAPLLLGAIITVIVVTGLLPGRVGQLSSGVGWLGLAALVYFYYGHGPLAAVLAIVGALSLGMAAARPR